MVLENIRPHILSETALAIAFLSGLALGATAAIDVGTKYQTIDGFGASTAWASTMSATDADLLWSTTTGAGLSLHRIRIGGGATSETSIAKLAVARGVKVWAAPWEVKAADISGNPPKLINAQDWANTIVTFVTNMKKQGVPIYAVSAENEPDSKGLNATTYYTETEMATWVGSSMGPALAATDTKVMTPETMNWFGIGSYLTALQNNADAWKYTSIVATHEYGGSPKPYPQIAQAGKSFWETEIYDTDNNEDPGMGSALRVAKIIHEAMTIANMNAWHFWWVYPSGNDNGALWDKGTNKPSKRLWIMGNYSRFVRPGYVRIGATAAPATGVTVSAYYGAKDNRVVIVAANTNTNATATSQTFSVANASASKATPWVTDANNSLVAGPAITPAANAFTFSLPSQSVTTLVVGVDSVKGSAIDIGKNSGTMRLTGVHMHFSGSKLRIEFTAASSGSASIQLFNLDGKMVKSLEAQTHSGKTEAYALDLKGLKDGFYIVNIVAGGSIMHQSKIQIDKIRTF